MARSRNIKPSIMDNEELAELEPLTRLLFIYLWMLADREGRLEDRPTRIAKQALGYDRAADVGAMLDELQRAGFIARYTTGGKACIQILEFAKHQTPHVREAASELPAQGTTKAVPEHNLGSVDTSPRSPDSGFLIPDSLIEESPAAAAPARKKPKAHKTPIPDDFCISERVRKWAKAKGFARLEEHLEAFVAKCKAKAYENVSWDDAFMEAVREDWAKLRGRGPNGSAPAPEGGTVPMNPAALYKPEPKLTDEQLSANRANAAAQLARLKRGGLDAIRKEIHA
jgi:hypothetical protein